MKIDQLKVLVTGVRGELSASFVLALARDGADVAFRAASPEEVTHLVAAAADASGTVRGFVTSETPTEEEVSRLVKDAAQALGGLNGLVNSDRIRRDGLIVKRDPKSGAVDKLALARWQEVIDVNQTANFLYTREFAAHCMESGTRPACVVTLSSISRRGGKGESSYAAAAAAAVAMTATWAMDLAPHGIRSGAVATGLVNEAVFQQFPPEGIAKIVDPVPLKRLGELEEIYLAVKFIFENEYVTGTCIDVVGGLRL